MKSQSPDPTAPDINTDIKWSQLWLGRAKMILALGLVLMVGGGMSGKGMTTIAAIGITLAALGGPATFLLWREEKAQRETRDADELLRLMQKNSKLEKRNRELEAQAGGESPSK